MPFPTECPSLLCALPLLLISQCKCPKLNSSNLIRMKLAEPSPIQQLVVHASFWYRSCSLVQKCSHSSGSWLSKFSAKNIATYNFTLNLICQNSLKSSKIYACLITSGPCFESKLFGDILPSVRSPVAGEFCNGRIYLSQCFVDFFKVLLQHL